MCIDGNSEATKQPWRISYVRSNDLVGEIKRKMDISSLWLATLRSIWLMENAILFKELIFDISSTLKSIKVLSWLSFVVKIDLTHNYNFSL